MKRLHCSRCDAPLRKKVICYSCGYNNEHLARKFRFRRILKFAILFTLIVSSILLCNGLLLFPWQRGARRNKQIILEYAKLNYPEAEVVEQYYSALDYNPFKSLPDDYIIFKQDSLKFGIFARSGKITIDDYPRIKTIAQFDKIIQDGFFKPQGIVVQTQYHFSDDYYALYPYTGGLGVTLRIRDQGSTPQEIGCLYDFYKYWSEEGDSLKSYSVFIDIVVNDIHLYEVRFNDSDIFTSEKEFNARFKRCE